MFFRLKMSTGETQFDSSRLTSMTNNIQLRKILFVLNDFKCQIHLIDIDDETSSLSK